MLFLKARAPDPITHHEILSNLYKLQSMNSEIDLLTLKLRYRLQSNYDGMVLAVKELVRLQSEIKVGENAIFHKGDKEIDQAFEQLDSAVAQKIDMIDRFKSYNAVLKNSFYYFPRLIEDIQREYPSNRTLQNNLQSLMHDLLLQHMGHSESTVLVENDIRKIEAAAYPEHLLENIQSLLQHAKYIVAYENKTTQMVQEITSITTQDLIRNLIFVYEKSFNTAFQTANYYNFIIFLAAFLLFSYAAYSFFRLRDSTKDLHDTYAQMEHQKFAMEYQANFDPLTLLPNRRLLRDRLAQEIKLANRNNLQLAVMFLDIDNFRDINDTLGHDMGDLLLKQVAQRLSGCVSEADTVARMGGDEFTILLGKVESPGSVERTAQDILHKFALPFQLGNEAAYISASIGITLYPTDSTDVDILLQNADQAMYAAKSQGRNRFSYFTAVMQEAAQRRMRLASDLRGALADHQLHVYYQPIVELATGHVYKAEALIHWQHPTRGLISPTDFIPLAEETGMIVDIGNWVFREAAQQAAQWRGSHHTDFQISVNLSPAQLHSDHHTPALWLDHLQKMGLPGQSIVVEITEGLLLDASVAVTDQLLDFRDAGIEVSLDDFGTGYSSLSYLKKFHIDYLKIDQSFLHNLAPGSDDMALCEAIIVMAHKLGLRVIAEGVENNEQRSLLAAAGCDYGQGHFFSKALPPEEFETLLQNKP
ncbi:MAG: EAL domain-containing protein [Gallionellaceae bacterium]|nr:EAL domain-containing protein [Gallionellaceae bacterium]